MDEYSSTDDVGLPGGCDYVSFAESAILTISEEKYTYKPQQERHVKIADGVRIPEGSSLSCHSTGSFLPGMAWTRACEGRILATRTRLSPYGTLVEKRGFQPVISD